MADPSSAQEGIALLTGAGGGLSGVVLTVAGYKLYARFVGEDGSEAKQIGTRAQMDVARVCDRISEQNKQNESHHEEAMRVLTSIDKNMEGLRSFLVGHFSK